MRRVAKPLIALIAAYGIVLSSLLASIVAGQGATAPIEICLSLERADAQGTTPAAPKHHDLTCLMGCNAAAAGLAPVAFIVSGLFVFLPIEWDANTAQLLRSIFGALSARGPPARI